MQQPFRFFQKIREILNSLCAYGKFPTTRSMLCSNITNRSWVNTNHFNLRTSPLSYWWTWICIMFFHVTLPWKTNVRSIWMFFIKNFRPAIWIWWKNNDSAKCSYFINHNFWASGPIVTVVDSNNRQLWFRYVYMRGTVTIICMFLKAWTFLYNTSKN